MGFVLGIAYQKMGKNKASLLQACISSMEKQTNKKKKKTTRFFIKEVKATPKKKENNPNSSFLVLIYVMFKICVHIISFCQYST